MSLRASDSSVSDIRNGIVSELFALFNISPSGVQRSSLDQEKRFIEQAAAYISANNSSSVTVSATLRMSLFIIF